MSARTAPHRWVCARCGVAVGQLDGRRAPLPTSWESGTEGDFCLACRRGRAADAAQEAAADSSTTDRAKARRTGLIEFEVRRTPDLSDGVIARSCRTSAAAVGAVRKRIGDGTAARR
ncbi:MAG TPA: hypothetical protein VHF50_07990 [Solirubrobacterales bacterium]|nr:hypothetical protein [Solirubrobacterales bacterium]